jgi:D-amino peptidase
VPTVERTAVRRVAYAAPSAYDLIRTFRTVTTMASAAVEATYG